MKIRWAAWLVTFLLTAIGGPVCSRRSTPALGPTFQGKSLDWWLSWWSTNRQGPRVSADGPRFQSADLSQCQPALSAIGPPAVPFVIKRLREKPPLRLDRQQAATYFGYIGSNAIPQLLQAMHDPDRAVRRACSLALVPYAGNALSTDETAQVFGNALRDPDGEVILASLEALDHIGPAASNSVPDLIRVLNTALADSSKEDTWKWSATAFGTHILAAIGPAAASAAPVLTNLLQRPGPGDELGAAVALWRVNSNTTETVPVLLKWSGNGYWYAFHTLGEMGPAAKAAVPQLLVWATNAAGVQQTNASATLKRIYPQAAAKTGIK